MPPDHFGLIDTPPGRYGLIVDRNSLLQLGGHDAVAVRVVHGASLAGVASCGYAVKT